MFNPKWLIYHTYRVNRFSILLGLGFTFMVSIILFGFKSEPELTKADSYTYTIDSLRTTAFHLQGLPYRFGGKNEGGFDCSGFTHYVYHSVGIELNASAAGQFRQGQQVHRDSLAVGDLVFFQNSNGRIFHVGLYVGEENARRAFIHASSSRGVVKDYLDQRYFAKRWVGSRRFVL